MGKHFGNLAKLTGITFFRLSPYEQKTFGGLIKDGIPNTIRRVNEDLLYYAPFFISTWIIMAWADDEYYRTNRKRPEDFENDK